MQVSPPERTEHLRLATAVVRGILQDALLALYLHGSAVSGGLRRQSDIDLLAVVDRPMTDEQRRELLLALLGISGRHPRPPGGPRCIELLVFLASDLAAGRYPVRSEFVYGEWLRDTFEAGEQPQPALDPEHTLILAQARHASQSLIGPNAAKLLPNIPGEHVRRAMQAALPALLAGLRGDERNVLLTLARMWQTARTGAFVSKDDAASWAVACMPEPEAATLNFAREAYLGNVEDEWDDRRAAAQLTAEYLHQRILEHA